jgi:RecA-family ATPase
MSKASDVQSVLVRVVSSENADAETQSPKADQARKLKETEPLAFPAAKTVEEFRKMQLPQKETLIEGILYRRDLVAFAGRRRNGKTSILLQLALSLTTWGSSGFLGHGVGPKRRVLLYLLEDDSRELQDRLNRMLDDMEDAGDTEGRLAYFSMSRQESRCLDRITGGFKQAIPVEAISYPVRFEETLPA